MNVSHVDQTGGIDDTNGREKDTHDKLEDSHEVTFIERICDALGTGLYHHVAIVVEDTYEEECDKICAGILGNMLIQRLRLSFHQLTGIAVLGNDTVLLNLVSCIFATMKQTTSFEE